MVGCLKREGCGGKFTSEWEGGNADVGCVTELQGQTGILGAFSCV